MGVCSSKSTGNEVFSEIYEGGRAAPEKAPPGFNFFKGDLPTVAAPAPAEAPPTVEELPKAAPRSVDCAPPSTSGEEPAAVPVPDVPVSEPAAEEPAKPAAEEPVAAEPTAEEPAVPAATSAACAITHPEDPTSLAASSGADLTALLLDCKLSVTSVGPFLRQMIDAVRKSVDQAVAKDPSIAPSAEMASDMRLIRFLGANKWDVANATAEYIEALGLRKKHNLDGLRDKLVAANPGFFTAGSDELECIYMHEKSRAVNEANPRTFTDVRVDGPYRPLLDKLGNLVVIECPGVVDYAAIAAVGMSAWELEFLTFNELRVLILDELSRRTGKLQLTNTVMDMSHISLMPNPFAPKAEKEGKKAASAVSGIAKAVYPTTTYKTYMVNLSESTAKMAGPAIKAFVPARSAAKLKIFGHDFKETLLGDVASANLPKRLGGELPDGNQWFWVDKKGKKGK